MRCTPFPTDVSGPKRPKYSLAPSSGHPTLIAGESVTTLAASKQSNDTKKGRNLPGCAGKIGDMQINSLSRQTLLSQFLSIGAVQSLLLRFHEKGGSVLGVWDPLGSVNTGAESIGAHCITLFLGLKPGSIMEDVYPESVFPLLPATKRPGRSIVRHVYRKSKVDKRKPAESSGGPAGSAMRPGAAGTKRPKVSNTFGKESGKRAVTEKRSKAAAPSSPQHGRPVTRPQSPAKMGVAVGSLRSARGGRSRSRM